MPGWKRGTNNPKVKRLRDREEAVFTEQLGKNVMPVAKAKPKSKPVYEGPPASNEPPTPPVEGPSEDNA